MRNDITYRLLSIALIFPLISPISSGSGIIPFLTERLSQVNFDANSPISESVEVKDPEIVAIIEALCIEESQNDPKAKNEADALKTGYISRGVGQFQPLTFLDYGTRYGLVATSTTLGETIALREDPELSKEIMYRMLEENINNLCHWENSAIKLGLIDRDYCG